MLPGVARQILDEAPRKEQFRVTAWWEYSQQEIIENVIRSLEALHMLPGNFQPYAYEQPFGLDGASPLIVRGEGDSFRVRGYIDRIDRSPKGAIRIIDYKTGGSSQFTASAVRQGKKLQLPLYALAARDALDLGQPEEGFYFHVQDARPSPFKLAKMGPETAIKGSVKAVWKIVRDVRGGGFTPQPPRTGCPNYCPAASLCWKFQPGWR
jgi:putative RecB family exonuclease